MFGPAPKELSFCDTQFDEKLLGTKHYFPNIAEYFAASEAPRGFAPWCIGTFVINKSGGTLAKGIRVLHNNNATYCPGVAVGVAAGADVEFAGFVCPFISTTTVAADAGFWLITKGFTKVGYDGSANFAIRDNLSGAASGWVNEATENYTDPWIIGKALEAKTSGSAGDLIMALVNNPFSL
jgi:hypothetical protein